MERQRQGKSETGKTETGGDSDREGDRGRDEDIYIRQ